VLPWMLYQIFRLERRKSAGLWLGFWMAFNLLNGIQYFTVYTVLIGGGAWLRSLIVLPAADRRRFVGHTVLALGVFLGLTGWRLTTTLLVYRDFPRPYLTSFDEGFWAIFHHLIARPSAEVLKIVEGTYFWSVTTYIGPVALMLAAISLGNGWRW